MSKKYTLELTAEELKKLSDCYPHDYILGLGKRLRELNAQAAADLAADELRLPWRAVCPTSSPRDWLVECSGEAGSCRSTWVSERVAKLRAAAPELFDAVQRCALYMGNAGPSSVFATEVMPLIQRALRKVETGVPE